MVSSFKLINRKNLTSYKVLLIILSLQTSSMISEERGKVEDPVYILCDSTDSVYYINNQQKTVVYKNFTSDHISPKAIEVVNNDVYILASSSMGSFYWRNNELIEIGDNSSIDGTRINDFEINEKGIYLTGERTVGHDTGPNYWYNKTSSLLQGRDNSNEGSASRIFVDIKNNVYISGYTEYYNETYNVIYDPCFWKNGVRIDLEKPEYFFDGLGFGLFVENSNVFVAGKINDRQYDIPCYWKNGKLIELSSPNKNSASLDIWKVNSNIYSVGYTTNNNNKIVPCFWENSTLNYLSNINGGRALAISVLDKDVYIVGFILNQNNNQIPCIWKNGIRTDIGNKGRAVSIFIVK